MVLRRCLVCRSVVRDEFCAAPFAVASRSTGHNQSATQTARPFLTRSINPSVRHFQPSTNSLPSLPTPAMSAAPAPAASARPVVSAVPKKDLANTTRVFYDDDDEHEQYLAKDAPKKDAWRTNIWVPLGQWQEDKTEASGSGEEQGDGAARSDAADSVRLRAAHRTDAQCDRQFASPIINALRAVHGQHRAGASGERPIADDRWRATSDSGSGFRANRRLFQSDPIRSVRASSVPLSHVPSLFLAHVLCLIVCRRIRRCRRSRRGHRADPPQRRLGHVADDHAGACGRSGRMCRGSRRIRRIHRIHGKEEQG